MTQKEKAKELFMTPKEKAEELVDKDIFDQATLAMEQWYGSGCETEIDAYFRGAKWMLEKMSSNV